MAAAQTIGKPTEFPSLELPSVDGTDRVPQRIPAEDEHELRWYLDDPPVAGLARTGGFGGQLERAEAFGYGALPCRACGGTWRRRRRNRDGSETVTNWRDGTGRRPKKHFGRQETYATALARYRVDMRRLHRIELVSSHPADPQARAAVVEAFRRRGQRVMTEAELRELFPQLPDDLTVTCGACNGIGVVPRRAAKHGEVTVWPTGSSKRTGAREGLGIGELVGRAIDQGAVAVSDGYSGVHLGDLERYLDVDRVLRDVAELSVVARVVLEEYYGPRFVDEGGRLRGLRTKARPTAFEALWPLTSVGPGAAPKDAAGRRAAEATALYDHACACWNLAAYGAGA